VFGGGGFGRKGSRESKRRMWRVTRSGKKVQPTKLKRACVDDDTMRDYDGILDASPVSDDSTTQARSQRVRQSELHHLVAALL
jgi:hypothetical protein